MDRIPDFYQLDESWYRYMKADREERKQMCQDNLDAMAVVALIFFFGLIGGAIYALCKGWV